MALLPHPPARRRGLSGLALAALLVPPIAAGLADTGPCTAFAAPKIGESALQARMSAPSSPQAVRPDLPARGTSGDHNVLWALTDAGADPSIQRVDATVAAP